MGKPPAAPCDFTAFQSLVNMHAGPRCWRTCAWHRRDVTEIKCQHQCGQTWKKPPPPTNTFIIILLFISPNSANQQRCSSKPFMGIWPLLSVNATQADQVESCAECFFSQRNTVCAHGVPAAGCCSAESGWCRGRPTEHCTGQSWICSPQQTGQLWMRVIGGICYLSTPIVIIFRGRWTL